METLLIDYYYLARRWSWIYLYLAPGIADLFGIQKSHAKGTESDCNEKNPRLCIRHKIVHAIYACLLFEQGKKERLSFPLLANREMMCEDMETQKV